MSEWKEQELGEYVDLISGYAFKSKDFADIHEKDFLPVIKIKNVANGDVNFDQVVYHKTEESLSKYVLKKGDVLIAMTGNHPHAKSQVVGDVSKYKLEQNALLNQRVGKFVAKKETPLDFIYFFLKDRDVHNYLANQSSGSANQANISKSTILGLKLNFPDLPEQKAIAEVLSSLDDKIDLLYRQNETLETMAETLFQQWFIEEAEEDWKEESLSEVANFLNGLACQKYPPKNPVEKLPVLKIRELKNGITESSDWASTDIGEEYIVENGDVIFSWSASLLVKLWDGETSILNQHLFKVTSERFPKWFIYLWCKYHLERFQAIARAHATTMGHIKRKDLDEALVKYPVERIDEIGESFEPIISKIIENNKQKKSLEELRDNLLPKLMCREARVG